MARINLLPWRAERRKQREREFYMMLAATAVSAVLVFMCASYWMGMRIDNQNERNTYLEQQIKLLEKDIEKIQNLEKVQNRRKAVVYVRQSTQTQVQTNRESKRRQYDLVQEGRGAEVLHTSKSSTMTSGALPVAWWLGPASIALVRGVIAASTSSRSMLRLSLIHI